MMTALHPMTLVYLLDFLLLTEGFIITSLTVVIVSSLHRFYKFMGVL